MDFLEFAFYLVGPVESASPFSTSSGVPLTTLPHKPISRGMTYFLPQARKQLKSSILTARDPYSMPEWITKSLVNPPSTFSLHHQSIDHDVPPRFRTSPTSLSPPYWNIVPSGPLALRRRRRRCDESQTVLSRLQLPHRAPVRQENPLRPRYPEGPGE